MEMEVIEIKTAGVEPDVHELIRRRWSPRSFADRSVAPDVLRRVLAAARWAPSAYNEQPWRFIVARREDPEAFDRLLACLNEGNRRWAQRAPVLMLVLARRTFSHSGAPNPHAWYDTGQAVAYLTLQATALGLYVHQMAGILPDEARRRCAIPEDYDVVVALALGYLGDPAQLSEDLQARERSPRTRRPLNELVYEGRWGNPARFLMQEDGHAER
ncbi:nitroreductase family protein [Rhodothermus marinus]|uniref:nitroreductase family protein n=1 Tax=Rhodothermus marinus TaxID=29549 RepID=UPI0037C576C7